MAVDNIDLSGEIKAWKDAAYGKDVRAANVAAFEKIQGTVNDTVQNVNQASEDASSASQNAQKAVDDIQSAIETATSKASEAAGSATAADTSKKAAASSAAAADNSKTQAAASAAEAKKIAQGLGDFDGTAAKVKTTDTYGLVVSALGESTAQALIDTIANKVMNELINKNKIVNNLLATDASTVLAGTQGAALDKRLVAAENAVTQLNSDIGTFYWSGVGNIEILSDKINNWVRNETNFITLPAGRYILGYKAHVQADSSVYIDTAIDTHDSDLSLYEKTMNMPVTCRDNVVYRTANNVMMYDFTQKTSLFFYAFVSTSLNVQFEIWATRIK